MKKILVILTAAALSVSIAGCGGESTSTPKSSELSTQYDYYSDSVEKIRSNMKISDEQADNVFEMLVSCRVDEKITYVFPQNDGTYKVWWGLHSVDVTMNEDGTLSKIADGKKILYPAEQQPLENSSSQSSEASAVQEIKSKIISYTESYIPEQYRDSKWYDISVSEYADNEFDLSIQLDLKNSDVSFAKSVEQEIFDSCYGYLKETYGVQSIFFLMVNNGKSVDMDSLPQS